MGEQLLAVKWHELEAHRRPCDWVDLVFVDELESAVLIEIEIKPAFLFNGLLLSDIADSERVVHRWVVDRKRF